MGKASGSDIDASEILQVGQQAAQTIAQNAQKGIQSNIMFTKQGIQVAQQNFQKAINYLNQGLGEAKAAQKPYQDASYDALDQYMDSMGIARPAVGSKTMAAALTSQAKKDNIEDQALQTMQNFTDRFPSYLGVGGNYQGAPSYKNKAELAAALARQQGMGGGHFKRLSKDAIDMNRELGSNPNFASNYNGEGVAGGPTGIGELGSSSVMPGVGSSGAGWGNSGGGFTTDVNGNQVPVGGGTRGQNSGYGPLPMDYMNNLDVVSRAKLANANYYPGTDNIVQTSRSPIQALQSAVNGIQRNTLLGYGSYGGELSSNRLQNLNYYKPEMQGILDQYYKLMGQFPDWQQNLAQAANMGLYGTPTMV